VGYKYERRFQRLIDDLISYDFLSFTFAFSYRKLWRFNPRHSFSVQRIGFISAKKDQGFCFSIGHIRIEL